MIILLLHQTLSSQVNLTSTTSTPRPPPHPRPPPPPSHASAAGQGVAPPLPSGIASPQGGPRVGARLRGVCAAPRPLRALGLPTGRAWRSVGGPRWGAARPASARARVLRARRRGPAHRGARGCRPGRVGALRVRRRGARGRCGVGPHWGVRQRRQVELEDAPGTLLIFSHDFDCS